MALAKEFNMAFFETSARTGHNVNETFFHISKAIKDKQQKAQANAGGQVTAGGKQKELANNSTRGSVLQQTDNKNGKKKKTECCKS